MKTENILEKLTYDGIKTNKIVANDSGNVILISIEKGKVLSAHKSNTDASIIILEGKVIFEINGEKHALSTHDMFSFKKDEIHEIVGVTNAKLILIK